MREENVEGMDKDFKEYKKSGKKPRNDYDRGSRERKREQLSDVLTITNHAVMLTVGLTVALII